MTNPADTEAREAVPGDRGKADAVGRLRMLVARQVDAQQAVEDEIVRLLGAGHSWTDIGAGAGLSRQGARQRYRRLLDA